MNMACDLAHWHLRAALRLERARLAISRLRAIAHHAVFIDEPARHAVAFLARAELFARRADIGVRLVIVAEVGPLEAAIAARGLVEDRDVRLDPAFIHHPAQHLRRAIGGIGNQRCGIEAEAIIGVFDHALHRPGLGLADWRGGRDIDDNRVLQIDEIVGAVGEEGPVPGCGGQPRRRIGR